MTTGIRFTFDPNEMRKLFRDQYKPVARAATKAVTEAGNYVRFVGGLDIGAAGFSEKWQKALSFKVYPKDQGKDDSRGRGRGPDVIDATAFIYHRIKYAWVFEEGANISGRPFLWLPLPAARRFDTEKARITPTKFAVGGKKLQRVNRPGKPPLLVGSVTGPKGPKVPLFVGIDTVTIGKHWHIQSIAEAARRKLPSFYIAAFEDKL